MRFRQLMFVLLVTILFSCNEDILLNGNEVPKYAIENSIQLFPGEILEQTLVVVEGVEVWKVKIENNSGAHVTFYWQKKYSVLFQIVGDKGPFNYELKPPFNILVFSTAKFLAFESYSKETLASWKLFRDPNHSLKWVYQFDLKGGQARIFINASSGDIL